MKRILIATSLAVALSPGTALSGSEPVLPGVSITLTSIVVIPPFDGRGGDIGGGIPVFFVVTPPTNPGGRFNFRLVFDN
jgi:hypothetical protein